MHRHAQCDCAAIARRFDGMYRCGMADKKRGARPSPASTGRKPPSGTKSVLVYLPVDLVANLEAWASKLNEGNTGPVWARSDVVKAALARAWNERGSKGEAP